MVIILGSAVSFLPSSDAIPAASHSNPRYSTRQRLPRLCSFERCRVEDDHHYPTTTTTTTAAAAAADTAAAGSYGRRGLMLSVGIPLLMFSLHQRAEGVDAVTGELSIIQSGVRSCLSKTKAAGVLRMVFHDAGTFDMVDNSGGMNGSIIYELDRPENAGLSKSAKVLEKAKGEIEKIQQVSWADLIAVGGTEAISLCGGPSIPIRLGRLDARLPDPQGRLPVESLDASALKKCFLQKGFSTQELVALSGAHTIGGKGFGNPNLFDNAYFKILLEKPWTSSSGNQDVEEGNATSKDV